MKIGGAPVVTLRDPIPGVGFVDAQILPGRGMMLLQARLRLPDGRVVNALHAPDLPGAAAALDGGPADFSGNASFAFGGAILAPYANRIRGRSVPQTREIETEVAGRRVRLPRNWGGKRPGAEQYAMHGLILDACAEVTRASPGAVAAELPPGDFGGRWPGEFTFGITYRIEAGALELEVAARNVGSSPAPLGLGWHPYFALASGDRRQARLRLPARARTEVNDYDEVLPTGRLLPVVDTPYDFTPPGGRPLAGLYLDDCFTDLIRDRGKVEIELHDPAAGVGLRIATSTPAVKAVQVYAPIDKPFVVVEPQFNLADPFSAVWPSSTDTGMASLSPGESVTYSVQVSAFAIGNPAGA